MMCITRMKKFFIVLLLTFNIVTFSPRFAFSIEQITDKKEESNIEKISRESIELNEKGVAIINKDPDMAEQFFKKALNVDSKNISALLNFATLKISQKKSEVVLNILEEYSNLYPKISDIHYLLGDIYFSNKNIDNALNSYKKVLILKPNTKGLYGKMGNIYLLQNDLNKSEFMYQEAYIANKTDIQILTNYANVLLANKKIDMAIKIAKEALALKETAEVYTTLGTAYEMRSDNLVALENYEKAKKLNQNQQGLDEKISSLKSSLSTF